MDLEISAPDDKAVKKFAVLQLFDVILWTSVYAAATITGNLSQIMNWLIVIVIADLVAIYMIFNDKRRALTFAKVLIYTRKIIVFLYLAIITFEIAIEASGAFESVGKVHTVEVLVFVAAVAISMLMHQSVRVLNNIKQTRKNSPQ